MLKEYLVAYWNQKYCSHASFLFMPVLPAGKMTEALERSSNNMQRKEDLELPLFDFSTLALLVGGTTGGGFETLRGDKTNCFITNPKLTN